MPGWNVWLDSLDSGNKIAECAIGSTGSLNTYKVFAAPVVKPVSGNHDVYLKFRGEGQGRLFLLQWLVFFDPLRPHTSIGGTRSGQRPDRFELGQNYPNPFNATTRFQYSVPEKGTVSLIVYNPVGRQVATLFEGVRQAGDHEATFDGAKNAGGVYFCRLTAGQLTETKKFVLLK
jgi:xylan 1,4-beta-xylosidase